MLHGVGSEEIEMSEKIEGALEANTMYATHVAAT